MKLMFVGVANIGKTTLLNQLRQEGTGSYQNSPPVGWTERKVKKRRAGSTSGKWTTLLFAAKPAFARRTYHSFYYSLQDQEYFRRSYNVSWSVCGRASSSCSVNSLSLFYRASISFLLSTSDYICVLIYSLFVYSLLPDLLYWYVLNLPILTYCPPV